jgi:hypothetical protein
MHLSILVKPIGKRSYKRGLLKAPLGFGIQRSLISSCPSLFIPLAKEKEDSIKHIRSSPPFSLCGDFPILRAFSFEHDIQKHKPIWTEAKGSKTFKTPSRYDNPN